MQNFYVKDIIKACNGLLLSGSEDILLETVSTDSNEILSNTLFAPIIGERVDAHRFIDSAIKNGAAAVLTSEHDSVPDDTKIPYIRVTNTTMALQNIGKYYGQTISIPKIGITGSVGKTTTKEMIACALSAGKKVFKTSGNNNSQIGVPLTLLKMSYDDDIAVIEMGMSMKGEMVRLSKLVNLNTAVVTNIGVSHIEQLKTQDGICEEKFHIQDALSADGTVFLNGDDAILLKHREKLSRKSLLFGLNENNDYRAADIIAKDNGISFTAIMPDGKSYPVSLKVLGSHNVRNALVAIAVADSYGISPDSSIKALSQYEGIKMRQQITVNEGVTVIDDSYNASPDSMKAGIDVLCSVKATGRRVAVLADMLELGNDTLQYHYEVGEYIGNKVSELILLGELSESIGKGAAAKGNNNILHLETREAVNEYLGKTLKKGDAVLFKGSRGMKLNECADYILKGQK